MKGIQKRKESKGKKPGVFKKQRISNLRRAHNQRIISLMKEFEICRGDLYALGPKGMCKCFVEALPAEPWHSYIEGIVVCLAGGKHKSLRLATVLPKDCGSRCKVMLHNNNLSSCFVEWDKVFGLVVSVEELEDNSKFNSGIDVEQRRREHRAHMKRANQAAMDRLRSHPAT